jgi:hypothetical protein
MEDRIEASSSGRIEALEGVSASLAGLAIQN